MDTKGRTTRRKLLLQAKGIDKNCTTPSGDTALMVAIRADAMNFVRLLLKYGADVNKANHFGRTPLHLASYQKSLEMITGLLLHRANPNVEDAFGNTPLCWCMLESPDVQVARRLLKWGANPDFRTIKPYPLLLELALNCKCEGDIAMIDILLEFEADINIRGEVSKFTALHVASITGYLPLAKFLLQNGSQIDSVDVTKRSPLDVATDHGHTELVAFYRSRLFEIERRARIVATASSLKRKSAADTQLSKTVTFDRLL
ncbi:cyclin-dependent kinase 4 inhibitor C-like [Cylas formicarius]|uniref:cyclin-dependent kinase 4 inhibitor C-like n=1 Tax=Cylas formicarius TaxID=197179 RepID=UPI002958CD55|nr:cyclin-dependent kinase 4 inhibitor C-like [Cylas formicarius]